MTAGQGAEAGTAIDTTVPHSARIWNYFLGGKDNYPIDRVLGDQFLEVFPQIRDIAQCSRAFLRRAIRHLAGEAGVTQFLDIGTGLPTAQNTHEVAQAANPRAKVVYVDNDPLVLAHANALLTSTPQGVTDYIHADLREPGKVIEEARKILDFAKPIGLNLSSILAHVTDLDRAQEIVRTLMAPMASGSHLVINDGTTEPHNDARDQAMAMYNESGAQFYLLRSHAEISSLFDGLEPIDPGLVLICDWRPDPGDQPLPGSPFGGVARKP